MFDRQAAGLMTSQMMDVYHCVETVTTFELREWMFYRQLQGH
jgi:hypothetical protein